jgi:EAL domain-containing protein (putative c-di-GMP-specific phosphodiesterase class I)
MGCRTALDDFGSGYANYTYLRDLPFDYLKIDGSFVRNLIENETDRALVGSMAEVARRFGLKSIAEFVHDLDLVPILKELGVDYGQGYALGMPVPLAQLGN